MKGRETEPKRTENDKTNISFVERQGTENDRTENEVGIGTGMPKTAESPPAESSLALASPEIISDVSANTFKARVEYAKSLGIEEVVAVRICNLAQN